MNHRSDYTAAQWANLFPEQRYAIEQAETDRALGRTADVMQVRGPDGRSSIMVDRATGKPIASTPLRRIGGL